MLIMENMAEHENIDDCSDDSRDFIVGPSYEELAREREEFFSEFIEEIDEVNPNLPPIPKLRIKIIKPPAKKRKKSSIQLDDSQPRHSERASRNRVSYEILSDPFIDDDFIRSPSPPIINRTSNPVKIQSHKPQVQGLKTHDAKPRPRYSVKTVRRDVEFNPDALPGTICYNSQKVYDQTGTTCHQCRQKTIDLKSRCYSPYCHGVRGQFCGYCLMQRYGEDVAVVLRDPKWKCPPCRRICNCSICRRSHGKPPTGQLYQLAIKNGFPNVKEYLAQLGDDKLEDDDPVSDQENTAPPENNVVRNEDRSPPVEVPCPLRIKEEPVDYEFTDYEYVNIKEEPVDFEGITEDDQVDYEYGEMNRREQDVNHREQDVNHREQNVNHREQDNTQRRCEDMIEFEPIIVKREQPNHYQYQGNVLVNFES